MVCIEYLFEGMRERAMADVVQQSGAQRYEPLPVVPKAIPGLFAGVIPDEFIADPAGDFVDSQRMVEAGVFGAVESIGRSPQLLDPAQALEFRCIDQIHDDPVLDVDVVMDRVPEYFFFRQQFRGVVCTQIPSPLSVSPSLDAVPD
eukprot:TRINITY_DN24414_c0_g1_i1.p3 TRINITY_DN24414_c0_g1~~TRINITY_DN24414_c0_g1_i1.p3  ORF type:complete len:146 (+),score=10.19 TRINITY_DN24414_c0_g1_i1:196-633(+)